MPSTATTPFDINQEADMFGVLLESKAGKQRRTAGATLSVATHVAIIGAAAAGTVHGTAAPPEKPHAVFVQIAPPKPRVIEQQQRPAPATGVVAPPSDIVIKHIDAPTIVPRDLPPIDMTRGVATDSIVVGQKGSGTGASIGEMYAPAPPSDNRDWDVRELLMNLLTPAKARYPESLRSVGVDGHVLVQFSVDTTGRVDMNSVKVLESTHDLFSQSVRDALRTFRFRPAEVGGHRVAALAQMPFEFHITR